MSDLVLRVAAVADVHCREEPEARLRALVTRMRDASDVLCFCGDLTDHGRSAEARVLAAALADAGSKPVLGVLGNHDHESGEADEICKILAAAGMLILAGDGYEIDGVGFAGAKGFGGGFGEYALEPWGEKAIKDFVHEAISESLLLEGALARIHTPSKVALLHYSPIRETVAGEPAEIMAYLGSSRLEEPLNRYHATLVLHGHAHHGHPYGRTSTGIPVYNVSLPVLRQERNDPLAFRLLAVPKHAEADRAVEA